MNRATRLLSVTSLAAFVLLGCGQEGATDLQVERLPDVVPNLPEVPQLPPPPHPLTYADGSYSVYGVRRRLRQTMDTEVAVTGYIVEVYQAPPCEGDETCPAPAAPHMFIADTPNETDPTKRLQVVGYADNQSQIDEARRDARRGRPQEVDPETGELPIPTDFDVGNKVKVAGQFARMSSAGFNNSMGLLDYRGHETLETASE